MEAWPAETDYMQRTNLFDAWLDVKASLFEACNFKQNRDGFYYIRGGDKDHYCYDMKGVRAWAYLYNNTRELVAKVKYEPQPHVDSNNIYNLFNACELTGRIEDSEVGHELQQSLLVHHVDLDQAITSLITTMEDSCEEQANAFYTVECYFEEAYEHLRFNSEGIVIKDTLDEVM